MAGIGLNTPKASLGRILLSVVLGLVGLILLVGGIWLIAIGVRGVTI